ncbi:MAG TPA: serine/threonine-protein kinase [Holophagaceae bacterium]|nr:serine/threonine-protein kinase [Holophagaceae bacterium]
MPDRPHDRIGKFEILRILGRGAMGEVYLAKDTVIGREVALKVIRPALAGLDPGGEIQARFQREARSAGILSHPHIVTVYEFGEDEGLFFLAMEYVEGEDFNALLAEKALSPGEILEVAAQVCEGLQQAHKHGILHRDIKPSNVMVTRDEGSLRAKLMDFGVAKATGAAATQTGQVVGTLAYMAPEYLRTGEAGPLTDLFSMGVMLHEALAGERPFGGATTGAVVYGIINDPPRQLEASQMKGLSPAIASLITGLLEKDPALRRPATAGELAKALRAAKDPAWRLPEDADATTAISKKALSGFAEEATTTAGRRALQDNIITGGHAAMGGKRKPLLIGAGLLLAAVIAFSAIRHWAAMPGVVAPTQTNMHVNDVVLQEAAQIAAKGHPEDALKLVNAVIDATPKDMPVDPDAYAVKLVCLYQKGWILGFGGALTESRFRGVSAKDLLSNAAYKDMLEKDRVKKKLPEKLRERLLRGDERADGADSPSAP